MLTDLLVRKLEPSDKPRKVSDSMGLYLYVTPSGGKSWRYKYRINGREKLLTIGLYPKVSLADARTARDNAREALAKGLDPAELKKHRAALAFTDSKNTFEAISQNWFEINKGQWTEKHAAEVWKSLEREIFPDLGHLPIKDISASQVLETLRKVEGRGAKETARRIRQRASNVFVFGIASGVCENDPAAQVEKAMAPLTRGRQPALTTLEECREIIRKVELETAHPVTKLAHRVLALTALRPGAVIATPWVEFDELDDEDPIWAVPADRMKLRLHMKTDSSRDHLIPMSEQAVKTIRVLRKFSGRGPFAFPNTRHAHRPMSENAIGYLLNRAGYHHKHVPHGWRASFSSIMNERRPNDRQIIDVALAHVPKDKVEGVYNRALYLKQRREIMQEWADILMKDQMPLDEVVKLPRRVYSSK